MHCAGGQFLRPWVQADILTLPVVAVEELRPIIGTAEAADYGVCD